MAAIEEQSRSENATSGDLGGAFLDEAAEGGETWMRLVTGCTWIYQKDEELAYRFLLQP